jgi:hypothetical protein
MYSIYWWTKFLYIIRTHFYVLLEQLFMHFYTIIYCWSTILYIVRTLWHKLLEQFSVHLYIVLYIIICIVWLGPSRFWYNNPPEEMIFCVLCIVPLLIIHPQSENNVLGWGCHVLDKIIPHWSGLYWVLCLMN